MLAAFVGNLGQGKTYSMTVLASYLHKKYKLPIYANYALKDAKLLRNFDDVLAARNGIVCLDEAHIFLDSRGFKDPNSRTATQWLLQTRKKDLIVLYTTQNFGQVDIRMRRITDFLGLCKRQPGKGITIQFVDAQEWKLLRKNTIFEPLDRFYHLYDTKEIVTPISFGYERRPKE